MTYEELKSEMGALVLLMLDKGVRTPRAEIQITSDERGHATIWCHHGDRSFDGEYMRLIYGGTLQEQITNARAYIEALPDPATEGARKFTRALANAIDIATEYALPDAAVAPVRAAMVEVNAVLLEAPK